MNEDILNFSSNIKLFNFYTKLSLLLLSIFFKISLNLLLSPSSSFSKIEDNY